MATRAAIARMVAALVRVAPLDALWLFGSAASGRSTPKSDVDLGELLAAHPSA